MKQRDLLVVTPSRGRPEELARLVREIRATRQADTAIAVAVDRDDPRAVEYDRFFAASADTDLWWHIGPRDTMAGWTNRLALQHADRFTAIASLGDDHLPVTPGWDAMLLEPLRRRPGIAYGDDKLQSGRLPTAPVISSEIVLALGWMCLPGLRHYYVDDVWHVLGSAADCLTYRGDVVVEHLHPFAWKAMWDKTYTEAGLADLLHHPDRGVFEAWLSGPCKKHFEVVREVVSSRVR